MAAAPEPVEPRSHPWIWAVYVFLFAVSVTLGTSRPGAPQFSGSASRTGSSSRCRPTSPWRSSRPAWWRATGPCHPRATRRKTEKARRELVTRARRRRRRRLVPGGADLGRLRDPAPRRADRPRRLLPRRPQPGRLRAAADAVCDAVQRQHAARISRRSVPHRLRVGDERRVHDGDHRRLPGLRPAPAASRPPPRFRHSR